MAVQRFLDLDILNLFQILCTFLQNFAKAITEMLGTNIHFSGTCSILDNLKMLNSTKLNSHCPAEDVCCVCERVRNCKHCIKLQIPEQLEIEL